MLIPLSASSRISQYLQVRSGRNAGLASLDFRILKRIRSDYLDVHGNLDVITQSAINGSGIPPLPCFLHYKASSLDAIF